MFANHLNLFTTAFTLWQEAQTLNDRILKKMVNSQDSLQGKQDVQQLKLLYDHVAVAYLKAMQVPEDMEMDAKQLALLVAQYGDAFYAIAESQLYPLLLIQSYCVQYRLPITMFEGASKFTTTVMQAIKSYEQAILHYQKQFKSDKKRLHHNVETTQQQIERAQQLLQYFEVEQKFNVAVNTPDNVALLIDAVKIDSKITADYTLIDMLITQYMKDLPTMNEIQEEQRFVSLQKQLFDYSTSCQEAITTLKSKHPFVCGKCHLYPIMLFNRWMQEASLSVTDVNSTYGPYHFQYFLGELTLAEDLFQSSKGQALVSQQAACAIKTAENGIDIARKLVQIITAQMQTMIPDRTGNSDFVDKSVRVVYTDKSVEQKRLAEYVPVTLTEVVNDPLIYKPCLASLAASIEQIDRLLSTSEIDFDVVNQGIHDLIQLVSKTLQSLTQEEQALRDKLQPLKNKLMLISETIERWTYFIGDFPQYLLFKKGSRVSILNKCELELARIAKAEIIIKQQISILQNKLEKNNARKSKLKNHFDVDAVVAEQKEHYKKLNELGNEKEVIYIIQILHKHINDLKNLIKPAPKKPVVSIKPVEVASVAPPVKPIEPPAARNLKRKLSSKESAPASAAYVNHGLLGKRKSLRIATQPLLDFTQFRK